MNSTLTLGWTFSAIKTWCEKIVPDRYLWFSPSTSYSLSCLLQPKVLFWELVVPNAVPLTKYRCFGCKAKVALTKEERKSRKYSLSSLRLNWTKGPVYIRRMDSVRSLHTLPLSPSEGWRLKLKWQFLATRSVRSIFPLHPASIIRSLASCTSFHLKQATEDKPRERYWNQIALWQLSVWLPLLAAHKMDLKQSLSKAFALSWPTRSMGGIGHEVLKRHIEIQRIQKEMPQRNSSKASSTKSRRQHMIATR